MQITYQGREVEINEQRQLMTRATMQSRASYISETKSQVWTATAIDAGPVAAEYTIWLQNTGTVPIVINTILTSNVDADVIWKLHSVTGTGATAAVITPVNLNLSSANDAVASCRGGAGGVSGLSTAAVIGTWYGGVVYSSQVINLWSDALVLGTNDAIAVEYDAGTGGAASVCVMLHNQY